MLSDINDQLTMTLNATGKNNKTDVTALEIDQND